MKLLRFEGYSDDTFSCTGRGIEVDLDTCASGAPVYLRVEAAAESMIVCGQYAPGPVGGWIIGIGPDDGGTEDKPIPEWGAAFTRTDCPYSPALNIVAPDDVKVTLIDYKGRTQPNTPAERDALVAELRRKNDDLNDQIAKWRGKAATVAEQLRRMVEGKS